MKTCCICKSDIRGIICKDCFGKWSNGPKGISFSEYVKLPYKPKPVIIPSGLGTAEDYPI